MATLGKTLAKEREQRGITLEEIAETTKINIRFLRYLEEDKVDLLPGKFFTRGIIRSYAKYVGLDENDVLLKYHEDYQMQKLENEEEDIEEKSPGSAAPSGKRVIAVVFSFTFVIAATIILYMVFNKKEPPPSSEVKSQPAVIKKNPPPQKIEKEPEEIKGINLDFTFYQETWIQIHSDGVLAFEGTKFPDEVLQIKAEKEVRIHVGNAGGFSYLLNNKRGKTLGVSGAIIKDLFITLDNLEEFFEEQER
jgi:transcriptional regulator with XRE-family HTH domain